jgi:hypothetical protein
MGLAGNSRASRVWKGDSLMTGNSFCLSHQNYISIIPLYNTAFYIYLLILQINLIVKYYILQTHFNLFAAHTVMPMAQNTAPLPAGAVPAGRQGHGASGGGRQKLEVLFIILSLRPYNSSVAIPTIWDWLKHLKGDSYVLL